MLVGVGVGVLAGFLTSLDLTGLALGFSAGSLCSFVILLSCWLRLIKPDTIEDMTKKRSEQKATIFCCFRSSEGKRSSKALTEGLLPD